MGGRRVPPLRQDRRQSFPLGGFYLLLLLRRQLAASSGVVGDEPLLYRLVQALAEHDVKAADSFGAQAQVLHVVVTLDLALGLGLVIKFLDIQRGQLAELDFPDIRYDVLIDIVLVVGGGGFPDGGLSSP